MWRLVVERIATLTEIETSWSICDVLDANDALDAYADAKAEAHKKASKKK